jgi:hypothetical protein
MLQQGWYLVKITLLHSHTFWAMYILGLFSSWGTSQICPAWSPSEHQLARICPQFGARVWSHAVRRRLFIVLMTAAPISPNVFSLRNFLSNIHGLFLTVHSTSFISIIHHIYSHTYIFYLHDIFTLSFLRIFMGSRLPSVPCVRYNGKKLKQWSNEAFNAGKEIEAMKRLRLYRIASSLHCLCCPTLVVGTIRHQREMGTAFYPTP